jgi:hypothetical protein
VKRRPSLFVGYWRDPSTGKKWRVTRAEMAEVWRLWSKHRDVREGRYGHYWRDATTGAKSRITQNEMREVWRLWARHADIRQGRA